LTILKTQKHGVLNRPKDEFPDIIEMQENAILDPLIKSARGEVEVDRLKDVVTTLELVICKIGSEKQAYVFKNAKDMINTPNSKSSCKRT
jgi:hypothetical protein